MLVTNDWQQINKNNNNNCMTAECNIANIELVLYAEISVTQ